MENRFTLADLVMAVALEYIDFRYPHNWRAATRGWRSGSPA
jgi:glutathione S-transferase